MENSDQVSLKSTFFLLLALGLLILTNALHKNEHSVELLQPDARHQGVIQKDASWSSAVKNPAIDQNAKSISKTTTEQTVAIPN